MIEYEIGTRVFDDWEIVREIGEGSYGRVFEVQKSTGGVMTRSALKLIRIPQSPTDLKDVLSEGMDEKSATGYFRNIVDQLLREIRTMSELKGHPNIVAYEDHQIVAHEGTIGWDILIRMEHLTSLADYQLSHTMEEADVRQLGMDLCQALIFCQKKGLIHRDIKPGNIFVSDAGPYKLGDFGVARTVEKTMSSMSRQGTEAYMAPEVYLNKSYGASVDIYSLGMVLYRLMNEGRLPFLPPAPQPVSFSDRENALSRRMKGETLPPPRQASPGFAAIILKACEYDSKKRYRTAAEFLEALKKADNLGANPTPGDEECRRQEEEKRRQEEENRLRRAEETRQKEEEEKAKKAEEKRKREEKKRQEEEQRKEKERLEAEAQKREEEERRRAERSRKKKIAVGLVILALLIGGLVVAFQMGVLHIGDQPSQESDQSPEEYWAEKRTGDSRILDHLSLRDLTGCETVTEVWFLNAFTEAPQDAIDVSKENDASVLAWITGTSLNVAAEGGVKGEEDCSYLFVGYDALNAVHFSNYFDVSDVKNMSSMFYGCTSLTALDFSGWDTSRVTDMSSMFSGCTALMTLDLSGWDTSRVTDMNSMFYGCKALVALNLSGWDTSRVTNMNSMFNQCSALTFFETDWLDTSKASTMWMYDGTSWQG